MMENDSESSDLSSSVYSMDPAINSGDFGRVVHLQSERGLSNDEKYYLLSITLFPIKSITFEFISLVTIIDDFRSIGLKNIMVLLTL